MNRLEQIVNHYWRVSYELRSPRGAKCHEVITTEDAISSVNEMDKLRPEDWRLREHMHVLMYDLIEGNSEWRDKRKETSSVSTLPMKN